MKKLLLSFILLFPLALYAQNSVILNGESGGIDPCWESWRVNTTTRNVIGGTRSFILPGASGGASANGATLTSPFLIPQAGNITLRFRYINASSGNNTNMRFSFGNGTTFTQAIGTINLANSTTSIINVSLPIPTGIIGTNGKIFIEIDRLSGEIVFDDLVIPARFNADPTNGCRVLPTVIQDRDGDGVADADDAFPDDRTRAFEFYLTSQQFSTLKFEDLWPALGDYDFNDLVTDLRIRKVTNSANQLVELIIESRVRAIGAGLRNGLGLELTGIQPNQVASVTGTIGNADWIQLASNGLETGTSHATIILFDDALKVLPRSGGGSGVNTVPGSPSSPVETQIVRITFVANTLPSSVLLFDNLNPFLIVNQTRGREIHLPGKQPTAKADRSLFGTISDNSVVGTPSTYISKDGNLPWAIWVSESVPYMIEREKITDGFLRLKDWATSGGKEFTDWYLEKPGNRNNEKIYKKD